METINDTLEELALKFVEWLRGDNQIVYKEKLDTSRLDFSLESLHMVDTYLAYLHKKRRSIDTDELKSTVLWVGAYLGEVIRRNAKRHYDWVDYDEYLSHNPRLQALIGKPSLAACALLCAHDAMTMPINKIVRFINEGPEHGTHWYATIECRQE